MKLYSRAYGQNYYQAAAYNGNSMGLYGCVNDARDWTEWVAQFGGKDPDNLAYFSDVFGTMKPGYAGTLFPNTEVFQCTREKMLADYYDLTQRAESDDVVFWIDSGHGTTYATLRELDGTGEAICCANGIIRDYELHRLDCLFKPGVLVFKIFDTCSSAGMAKAADNRHLTKAVPPHWVTRNPATLRDVKAEPQATIITFAACGENETSADTPTNGAFTKSALTVWESYGAATQRTITPARWHADTAALMREQFPGQHPQLRVAGPDRTNQPIPRA